MAQATPSVTVAPSAQATPVSAAIKRRLWAKVTPAHILRAGELLDMKHLPSSHRPLIVSLLQWAGEVFPDARDEADTLCDKYFRKNTKVLYDFPREAHRAAAALINRLNKAFVAGGSVWESADYVAERRKKNAVNESATATKRKVTSGAALPSFEEIGFFQLAPGGSVVREDVLKLLTRCAGFLLSYSVDRRQRRFEVEGDVSVDTFGRVLQEGYEALTKGSRMRTAGFGRRDDWNPIFP
eukprot:Opistho-1_new@39748